MRHESVPQSKFFKRVRVDCLLENLIQSLDRKIGKAMLDRFFCRGRKACDHHVASTDHDAGAATHPADVIGQTERNPTPVPTGAGGQPAVSDVASQLLLPLFKDAVAGPFDAPPSAIKR